MNLALLLAVVLGLQPAVTISLLAAGAFWGMAEKTTMHAAQRPVVENDRHWHALWQVLVAYWWDNHNRQ